MSQNILLIVKESLKKASKINDKRIDVLLNNMRLWKKDKIIYPNFIKSLLHLKYKETYEVLEILRELDILEYRYEIYCSKCNKFVDYRILESLNEFPESLHCEEGHNLDPLKDVILIYKVIKDE